MSSTPLPSLPKGVSDAREVAELRFQKLFEDADAMSIQGYLADGTVVYWNRASEHIYGYSAAEAMGGNLLDLIIPHDMRTQVEGAVRWMFENGQGIPPSRMNLRHKQGHLVPVYSSHTVVSIDGRAPVMFCMDADMSALAKAEHELRIAATAFDSQQGMLITDRLGVILRVNSSFTLTTGYTEAEAVGQSPRLLSSDRHPAEFWAAMWQSLHTVGSWQAEVWNKRKNGEIYADWVIINAVRDVQGEVTHFVGTLTDISQRKEAEGKIVRLAFFDPLTNLPNRRLMQDRLHQAISASQRNESCGALLCLDLDNFKLLNDSVGHDVGDLLLQKIAQRLTENIRDCDTAARFGGDTFLVMLEDLGADPVLAAAKAELIAQKLLDLLRQPHPLPDQTYQGSVSMGITLFGAPEDGADTLIQRVELAMYQAKAAGRNTLRFFDPQMQAEVSARAALELSLRGALGQNQFLLYYQAQVDQDGHVIGVEALLRWQDPRRGLVPPAEFIPLAEETGLILPLGLWVLETACQQLVLWAERAELAHLTVAVNVSALQFQQSDFAEQVLAVLARTGARADRLKLELTESLLVSNVEDVVAKMKVLKASGVGFSLDDFGTGYSSLSCLKRLPLDQLKIDQGFVRNLLVDADDAAIAKMIIALADSLGLEVIAEGVETAAQLEYLAGLGCRRFQGYLFSQPLPVQSFEAFVSSL
ncbi:putative bifunctional diguanylate cyclase/phosphodiesterase [Rhodoferax sp.]|uniref:putative bifunctional diguanylate cyclase/phosphodiesterase n=1 Tax=Rhodoferax sp. TaxID=50421 RepID=UPI002730D0A1|nr:bifunctional diguanylate cyclase/phosphodiesterase [Rhodoferax sp.]MDP1530715.1 EAL domain-containing protein [Rhodoferax sp.]MDP1944777.1 EAL domain-containing protein [Rhodoferax sp.]MDP2443639.1 EAL domain-containing protein [Rhodoferax sp.]MDZ4208377.1 EAL domain-containing protein [Rhodoferax sp.]